MQGQAVIARYFRATVAAAPLSVRSQHGERSEPSGPEVSRGASRARSARPLYQQKRTSPEAQGRHPERSGGRRLRAKGQGSQVERAYSTRRSGRAPKPVVDPRSVAEGVDHWRRGKGAASSVRSQHGERSEPSSPEVSRGASRARSARPLYPQKRTSPEAQGRHPERSGGRRPPA